MRASGVSRDTTADAPRQGRFQRPVGHPPDLRLIELGGNDLLQGIDPNQTRANLTAIIDKLKCASYPRDADRHPGADRRSGLFLRQRLSTALIPGRGPRPKHVPVYLFLLEGLNRRSGRLVQRDGIHPNLTGGEDHRRMKLAGAVAKALASAR